MYKIKLVVVITTNGKGPIHLYALSKTKWKKELCHEILATYQLDILSICAYESSMFISVQKSGLFWGSSSQQAVIILYTGGGQASGASILSPLSTWAATSSTGWVG